MENKIYVDLSFEELKMIKQGLSLLNIIEKNSIIAKIPITILQMSLANKSEDEIKKRIEEMEKDLEKENNKEGDLKVGLLKNKIERIMLESKLNK